MTLRLGILFSLLCALCGTAFAAPVNLVTNGSFEQGALNIGSFAGWTTTIPDSNTFVDSSGQTGTAYGQATDGKWAAYFGTPLAAGGASIAETLSTTAGQVYALAFDLANDNGGGAAVNGFSAFLNNTAYFTAGSLGNQGFARQTLTFQAMGTSTALRLAGYNNNGYLELDNVSVTAVSPEPSTFALLLTGMAGVAGAVRKRFAA